MGIDEGIERTLFIILNSVSVVAAFVQTVPVCLDRNRWKFPQRLPSLGNLTLICFHSILLAGVAWPPTDKDAWCRYQSITFNFLTCVIATGWVAQAWVLYAFVVKGKNERDVAKHEYKMFSFMLIVSVGFTSLPAIDRKHGSNSKHKLFCWIDEESLAMQFAAL